MAVVGDLRMLLRVRDFRRLLTVRLLSQAADGVFQVALATYVVFSPEKQTSAAAIASAMAVLLLPYSLIGPFAGVLLDRWRRRQVFLYGNLLRAVLAALTAALMVTGVPDWLFYVAALCVTAVNRFVLAGLSAALPRVVACDELVIANALSPTAGTLAATAGGGLAFLVRLLVADSDAVVLLLGGLLYLASAGVSLTLAVPLLGPDPGQLQHLRRAVAGAARGLVAGVRHLREPGRRGAARALAAMAALRFCYGALTVMLLMLCRYAWSSDEDGGLALLGVAVAVSGAGFFVAALVTPSAARRLGAAGWIVACAAGAGVLELALGLTFAPVPLLAGAFVLGVATQGAKIATDTIVQASVSDDFRGRIFSVYDVLFNVAFVAAAGVSALLLPADGKSAGLVVLVALIYGAVAVLMTRFDRQ
ncbi:MFS transporter [Streptomyces sp. FT1]|uniref:MFS transporter n=1 Tax=Streptomyces sp. FT1 TaxID=2871486 RepID=UPI00224F37F3|nr:MFS transporter [Streptomyces sp. FT1]MCX5458731.1 MFS transporter [Streptomyces sp. FT1]